MKRKLRLLAVSARYFLLPTILLMFTFAASAQKQVTGVVKSATGPVSGATVAVKDASVATQTGTDGTFTITVPAGRSILVYLVFVIKRNIITFITHCSDIDPRLCKLWF